MSQHAINVLTNPKSLPEHCMKILVDAAKFGHIGVMESALRCPRVDIKLINLSVLELPWWGTINTIEMLIDAGINLKTVIVSLGQRGDVYIMKMALSKIENIDITEPEYFDAFEFACKFNHIEIVKLFLEKGIDPSQRNNRAIECAANRDGGAVVKLLLKDPRVDSDAINRALINAMKHGFVYTTEILLRRATLTCEQINEEVKKILCSTNNFSISIGFILIEANLFNPESAILMSRHNYQSILTKLLNRLGHAVDLRHYIIGVSHRTVDTWTRHKWSHLMKYYWHVREICREYLTVDLLELLM